MQFVMLHSKATNIVGSEIMYKCTSTPNVYEVEFKIYLDCAGTPLCSCPNNTNCSIPIAISGAQVTAGSNLPSNPCAGQNFPSQNISILPTVSNYESIQLCNLQKTICTNCGTRTAGSFTPGIEIYRFKGLINLANLPANCCLVNIGYSLCCRSSEITTLVNPASLPFYTQATINRCVTPCNSSPVFTTDPVFVTCANQDFSYNIGALDPDGDSLSYAFGSVLTSAAQVAPYQWPYNANIPMPYLGIPQTFSPNEKPFGIHLNPKSGLLEFRPQGNFVSNLIVEVRQWRRINGLPTLVGISNREFIFHSIPCSNNNTSPAILTYTDSNTITDQTSFIVASGKSFCLKFVARDSTASWDSTFLTWNNPPDIGLNGATFTKLYNNATRGINGPKYDSVQFCWTPTSSMSRILPYYFTVTAKDQNCPLLGFSNKTFAIYNTIAPTAIINKINNSCGNYNFTYSQTNYVNIDTVSRRFLVQKKPNVEEYTTYASTGLISHKFKESGWHKIKLYLLAITEIGPGPESETIDSVFIPKHVKVNIASKRCLNNGVQIRLSGNGGIPIGLGYNYSMHKIIGNSNQLIRIKGVDSTIVINYNNLSDTTYFYAVIYDLNDCRDTVYFSIINNELIKPSVGKTYNFCSGVLDTIDAGNNEGKVSAWLWQYNNTIIDSVSQKIVARGAGNYFVRKSGNTGCFVIDTITVKYGPPLTVNLSAISTGDSCAGSLTLKSIKGNGFSYQWFRDNFAITNQTSDSIIPLESGNYHVKVTDVGLCTWHSDTFSIIVYPVPPPYQITGQRIGLDTIKEFTYSVPYFKGFSYRWQLNNAVALGLIDSNIITVKFLRVGNASITALFTNQFGCSNQRTAFFNVQNGSVGLNQQLHYNNKVVLYPNPASDVLHVSINRQASDVYTIKFYNNMGQLVLEQKSTDHQFNISLQQLAKESIYEVQVFNNKQQLFHSEKIVIMSYTDVK
jgi:hypothetical protein